MLPIFHSFSCHFSDPRLSQFNSLNSERWKWIVYCIRKLNWLPEAVFPFLAEAKKVNWFCLLHNFTLRWGSMQQGCGCWATFIDILWLVEAPASLPQLCEGQSTAQWQPKLVSGSVSCAWHGKTLTFTSSALCYSPRKTWHGKRTAPVSAFNSFRIPVFCHFSLCCDKSGVFLAPFPICSW